MKTFFERSLGLERAEVLAASLEAQVEGYGAIDVPLLSRELRRYAGGDVLDVGTGNGSFLLKVAEANPDLRFVGIDHSVEFLAKARAGLDERSLPNVQLRQAFFDAEHAEKHDVLFTRFTLQHSSNPHEFIRSVYRSLNPGGMFVAIEPIYDYYDSDPPDPVWSDFRARMFATYERWGSNPNVPRQATRWLRDGGFELIRVAINMCSPTTIGRSEFAAAILTTAVALGFDYPDIWEQPFIERLEEWIQNPPGEPYVSIGHIAGFKAGEPPAREVRREQAT
jgi:SAM-dependent methyltransferase